MPRPPRRPQGRDPVTTTPTRPTATNAITAAIPPFMLETPPHAPFVNTPIPPSTNPGNSIVPERNIHTRRNARAQQQTPTANGPPSADNSQISNQPLGSAISEAGQQDEHSFLESVQQDAEDAKQLHGLRDISSLATWTLSSAKPGCALPQLRHPSPAYFWQSDGPQPHTLTLHFFKLVAIVKMRIYLDFELDESYTPTKMRFFAGMSEGALVEFGSWEVLETTNPDTGEVQSNIESIRGWIDVSLKGVGGRETRHYPDLEFEEINTDDENVAMLNAGSGRRSESFFPDPQCESKIAGGLDNMVGGDVLKAMVVQVQICENHQNGKDTHVRGFQVFAKDETVMKEVRKRVKKNKHTDGAEVEKDVDEGEDIVGLQPADWMGEPELR